MKKSNVTIIHNHSCSKSRASLKLLQDRGIEPQIIEYLNGTLSRELLTSTIHALKLRPKDILRTQDLESLGIELNQNNDQEVIDTILKHPKLLERPIIIKGDKAVIGRPPENVLKLID